jgi:D-glucuronyl C5-epimerase C-terminus/Putative peptidoglycan binding domain
VYPASGGVRSPAYGLGRVPAARATDAFFVDDDFAWVEPGPAVDAVPAPPPVLRPRRRAPPRTLAGDLRRLRAALAGAPSVPIGDSALATLVVTVVLLVAGVTAARTGLWPPAAESASTRGRPAVRAEAAGPFARRPAIARPLGIGKVGPAVLGAQQALALLGVSSAAPDGGYGEGTAAAVRDFQATRGVAADGVIGAATADAMRRGLVEAARDDAVLAIAGLTGAAGAGRLSQQAARQGTRVVERAADAVAALAIDRGSYIARVLDTVAAHRDSYDGSRTVALIGMLAANVDHLAKTPPRKHDLLDADGVAHRFFATQGFQFHPLASFVRLNASTRQERARDSARLARAMVARGVRQGDALVLEYYFPFGGPSRWVSGLAQAVGAQSLARAGELARDRSFSRAARAAYAAIPATLSRPLADGVWVREYGYSDSAILNAQLQTIVSLTDYVRITGDEEAGRFVAELTAAARTLLPRFDTGCWSLYMLDGSPASLAYHTYHVALLRWLARTTGEEPWVSTAARWAGYLRAGGCS